MSEALLTRLARIRREFDDAMVDVERHIHRSSRTNLELVVEVLEESKGNPLAADEVAAFSGLSQSAARAVLYGNHERFEKIDRGDRVRWRLRARAASHELIEAQAIG